MKTIDIKGKAYVMVNTRLKEFRENEKYLGWSLTSEILQLTNDGCVIKAVIADENGVIKATGLAQEDRTSSMINKTSYVENCETSAWGRALGNLGIGIDESIASAEEVNLAIAKQNLNEQREIIGGDFEMPAGKHKGTPISMIPDDYLDWYLQNGYDDFIKANIKKYKKDLYESDHNGLNEVNNE